MSAVTTTLSDARLKDEADAAPSKQRDAYYVLPKEERARPALPVRRTFYHRACETKTVMHPDMAASLACDPALYKSLYCCHCAQHFAVSAFRWPDGSAVGGDLGAR